MPIYGPVGDVDDLYIDFVTVRFVFYPFESASVVEYAWPKGVWQNWNDFVVIVVSALRRW